MRLEYVYPTEHLLIGGSYSNEELFARLHATTDVAGVWSAADDQHYCGKWALNVYVDGVPAQPTVTTLASATQTTTLQANEVRIDKTFLTPENVDYRRVIYLLLDVHNQGGQEHSLVVTGDIRYPERAWLQFSKVPDLYQKLKRVQSKVVDDQVVSTTLGRPDEVRVLAADVAILERFFDDQGVQFVTAPFSLAPGERRRLHFTMTFSNQGEAPARAHLNLQPEALAREVARTTAWWEGFDHTTHLITPSALVNRGLAWSKINMARQRVRYPCGWGFTNDPPQDVMVVRDAAWFILGSDYLMPDFSLGMLELMAHSAVEPTGKMTEYVLCCEVPPYRYDYGLNVNDDTPLFIISVWHHLATTGNEEFIRSLYPLARDAAAYLLSQRLGEQGLIYCTSDEANLWGIAGWRNIIPGYQQNGAVTEINAEAYAAFSLLSQMAGMLGDVVEQRKWAAEAEQLRERINRWLISPRTGLYLVNIDTSGQAHEQLTGDMVFPLMFGVADEEMTRRTLLALYDPEFWTPFGVRTVGKNQPGYDPEYGMRLTGGIWPNLTAWVAYASRKLYPEKLVEGMENIYRLSEVPIPRQYRNVVPGQFPECLHGENFESRGMSLSPWMPATYLWLGLEGLLGIEPGPHLAVNPHLPPHWHWAGVRSLPWRGNHVTMFVARDTLFSTIPVTSDLPVEVFPEDVTPLFRPQEQDHLIALRRGEEAVIFIGAPEDKHVELHLPPEIAGRPQTLRLGLEAGNHLLIRL